VLFDGLLNRVVHHRAPPQKVIGYEK
jgi:hypothetical protein